MEKQIQIEKAFEQQPTYRVYFEGADSDGEKQLHELGTVTAHSDGKGFTVQLDTGAVYQCHPVTSE